MNERLSDAEKRALTLEEAVQVLSLTPEGLRRLADLDEAIMELQAARRSLLANRLESIRDALAMAHKGKGSDPGENGERAKGSGVADVVTVHQGTGDGVGRQRFPEGRSLGLESELRMLRTEVAELRRELADLKKAPGVRVEAELQQFDRRLSYLEAELDSRQI